ncbi:MAG: glutamate-5-semialdehyde dehydrogenase [Proteobacteria bacterium]|nr:glutamate-5-semialdehyde dehydrogenase [Pseudomonadota bacterium]NCA28909.1 glutamate-5-semialdehyde dehydrogenase [Pseudomonadota bacterium]
MKQSRAETLAEVLKICNEAKSATKIISKLDEASKNRILMQVKNAIIVNKNQILKANKIDLENAHKNGLESSKIDRLLMDENKINNIVNSIDEIINLPDPVGKISYNVTRPNGLNIRRITTPIGVLLAIYESRPNVTADIASLAIKSGNVVILRSGSESINSSKILADIFKKVLAENNLPSGAVSFCNNPNRELIKELLKMDKFIDVVIPRGGKSLILAIAKHTRIPLFKHLDGNCHTYIHEDADFEKARKILFNAKMRRVGICGATESVLVDKKVARKILPILIDDLINAGCEVRGDNLSRQIDKRVKKANKKDYYQEYLDKILSLKVVNDINEAIDHIAKFGSSHTESIVTENSESAQKFLSEVDSAIVMHNASTQFADGGEFGLGAEVGISTGRLHARGPVGLEQLTTYKYQVVAECAIRK